MSVTLKDVAKYCKVSRSTASQILKNPNNERFAAGTRKEVIEAAAKLTYVPNILANHFRHGKTGMIALVLPYNVADLMNAVERLAENNGYGITVQFTPMPQKGMEEIAIRDALARQVDGIIWLPAYSDSFYPQAIKQLRTNKTPCVILESELLTLIECDNIQFDYPKACETVIGHFYEQEYKSIVYFADIAQKETWVANKLMSKFLSVASGYGITAESLVIDPWKITDHIMPILDKLPKPVGFFCENDPLTTILLSAVKHLGLSIPEPVGIIGAGDVLFADKLRIGELLTPTITAIRRPYGQMAALAVELLVGRIDNHVNSGRKVTLPMELTVRQSASKKTSNFSKTVG